MRATCEALEKKPIAALEYIRRQSRRTETFCAHYERHILPQLYNPLGPYITRGIWAAPRAAGVAAVVEGCPLEIAESISSSHYMGFAGGTPTPTPF
jgi:hypothetical protein